MKALMWIAALLLPLLPVADVDLKVGEELNIVNFEWRPNEVHAVPGDEFELELFAVPADGNDHEISIVNFLFQFDAASLDFTGLHMSKEGHRTHWSHVNFPPGGWNSTIADGNARLLLVADSENPPTVTQEGLRIGVFTFRMTDPVDSSIEILCDEFDYSHSFVYQHGLYFSDILGECDTANVMTEESAMSSPKPNGFQVED
jgi:hypothetical protein